MLTSNNQPFYQFGLGARLMRVNGPCVKCNRNAGFTLKSTCEVCSPLQDIVDTAFSALANRNHPVEGKPGWCEIGEANLDQLEASLVAMARHMGLEQKIGYRPLP